MREGPSSSKPHRRVALRALQVENARLRQQVVELCLEIEGLREIASEAVPPSEDNS
jgi:hypothetical protein